MKNLPSYSGRGLQFLTLLLLAYVSFICNKLVIEHFHERRDHIKNQLISGIPLSPYGTYYLFAFNFNWLMTLLCFVRASVTDPGYLPLGLEPPKDHYESPHSQCKRCKDAWKPPRAHHCRQSNRCVFKMEAYCFWLNNCVGVNNRKHYILFLWYTMLTALMTMFLQLDAAYCIMFVHNEARRAWLHPRFWHMFWACFLCFMMGGYFAYHCYELVME